MSHPPVTEAVLGHPPAVLNNETFGLDEMKQFDADDTTAGKAIGQMLSLLFFYTVIVMALSTFVTYLWVRK